MLHRDQRTPFSDWWWTVDKLLLSAIAALMLGGVILSLAASPPVATRIGLDPFHFFGRHMLFLLPSLLVMIGVSFLSPKQIRRLALLVFVASIILIVATLAFGAEVKGSRRWIFGQSRRWQLKARQAMRTLRRNSSLREEAERS